MSDVVFRGSDDSAPTPERAVIGRVFEAPESADTLSQDQRDHLAVEESVKALRKRREQEGDPWNPGPVIERKYVGDDKPESISLRRANEDMGLTKRGEAAYAQLEQAKQIFGPTFSPPQDTINATVDDAHRWGDGVKAPPRKIGLKDIDGTEIKPLEDRVPIRPVDALKNARDAALLQSNWREARAEEAQNFAAALDQTRADEAAESERQAQEQARVQQEQAAQRKAEQDRANAEAAQRQADAFAGAQQLSLAEAKLAETIQQWDAWAQQFPEMMDETAFAVMARNHPERHRQFIEARQARDAVAQRLAELQAVRAAGEMQVAAVRQHQIKQWGDQQDAIFVREVAKRHPHIKLGDLQKSANEYLEKDMGLSKQQIDQMWNGGALRNAGAQLMLADAAAYRMSQARAKEIANKRVQPPPVQVPGVARPRFADGESIASLERRMASAGSEREQLRLSVALTRALRAAGRL